MSRFSGLASEHLLHADTSPNSKVGEVLAITLLGNASLGDTTHQGAKIQLINAAKARHSDDANSDGSQSKCTLIGTECSDLREVNEKLSDAIEALTEALNVSGRGNTLAKAKETMDQVRDTLTSIETIQKSFVDKITNPQERPTSSLGINVKAKRLPIYLDDAISVIRSLEQGPSAPEGSITATDVEAIVHRTFLAAKKKPEGSVSKITEHEFNRKLKTMFGQSRKEISKALQRTRRQDTGSSRGHYCKDCGSRDHLRGDLRCKDPSFFTLQRREKSMDKNGKKRL